MRLKTLVASATAALLTACGSVDVAHYAAEKPALSLPSFFNGPIEAWGIFQKRNGEVARRFTVEIQASWVSPTEGTLDEHFSYSDGETQRRVWTLKRQPDGSWQGTADDVVGVATGQRGMRARTIDGANLTHRQTHCLARPLGRASSKTFHPSWSSDGPQLSHAV